MARKPDFTRIYLARRAATAARLTSTGLPEDDAERWLRAWEAKAAAEGLDRHDREFWTRGREWIESQRRR